MWSRWRAKQRRGIVPLRLLASCCHENGQPTYSLKSVSAPSWTVTLGSVGKGACVLVLRESTPHRLHRPLSTFFDRVDQRVVDIHKHQTSHLGGVRFLTKRNGFDAA
jgi:hypothetical protein